MLTIWVYCKWGWLESESIYRFDNIARQLVMMCGWPPPRKRIEIEPCRDIRQWFYENEIRAILVEVRGAHYLGFQNPNDAFSFKMRFA